MKRFFFVCSLVCGLLLALPINADVYVIVNDSNTSNISENDIRRIFLGKIKTFPDGKSATPITPADNADISNEFSEKVLNKTSSQLKSYWSKLIFTGKGTPPAVLSSEQEIIESVAAHADQIGYVSTKPSGVKIVAEF